MKSPLHYRKDIPFFYDKTETEFQQDAYERFDPMVIRQTALHLADDIWGRYPFQDIFDFAKPHLPEEKTPTILEIGCGTGRWIANLAECYPQATCWGIDYSYQMLKRANEYWIKGQTIQLDCRKQGFSEILELKGQQLKNLHLGLAKASDLPLESASQDLIVHSFLLDRVDDLKMALLEMHRILASGRKMIFVTPLNFQKATDWEQYTPPTKIHQLLLELDFEILEWTEDLTIFEPLDVRENAICWKCIGVVVVKK